MCPQCGHPFDPASATPPVPQTSGSAVGSLVFGLLWLFGVGSIIAVVLGHKAKSQIRKSRGRLGGSALATAGLILGYVGITAAIGALIAVGMLGARVNSELGDEGPQQAILQPPRATTQLSSWVVPSDGAIAAWAVLAVNYAESRGVVWNDRDREIDIAMFHAEVTCRQLSGIRRDSNPLLSDPGDVGSLLRQRIGEDHWDVYGSFWFDSLVNDLCVG